MEYVVRALCARAQGHNGPEKGANMRRTMILLAAVALLTVAVAAPATATKPDKAVEYWEYQEYLTSCDGFDLVYDVELKATFTAFYDRNGDVDHYTDHYHLTGILHRDDGTGPSVVDHSSNSSTYEPETWEIATLHGAAWNTVLPGIGPVVKVTGNIGWDESTGWPPVLTATGWNVNGFDLPTAAHETLCEYFG